MQKINCNTDICVQPAIVSLVECWNECPFLPTKKYPVAANQVIEYGSPLKLVAGKVAVFLPADATADLIGFAYHAETTGAVVDDCAETCVIVREAKLRKSAMKLEGFTAAQIDALVVALEAKRISVNLLA